MILKGEEQKKHNKERGETKYNTPEVLMGATMMLMLRLS